MITKARGMVAVLVLAGIGGAAWWVWLPGATPGGGPDPALNMVSVRVPALTPREEAGAATFDASCAACHGAAGAGQEGRGPPLIHPIYEPGHHPDGAFYAAAQLGVHAHHWPFGDMTAVEGITEAEIDGIVAYIRALQRENGIY